MLGGQTVHLINNKAGFGERRNLSIGLESHSKILKSFGINDGSQFLTATLIDLSQKQKSNSNDIRQNNKKS